MTPTRPIGRPPGADPEDMRAALVVACWAALLANSQSGAAVSVAGICRDAGCTPPTLYHHFANLADLQRVTCEEAFERWARTLDREIGTLTSPRERVRRRGHAYVLWGIDNPGAYRVLFINPNPSAETGTGPGRGFTPLLTDLSAALELDPSDPQVLTAALAHWSAVHGLTSLLISNPHLPRELWEAVLAHLSDALLPR